MAGKAVAVAKAVVAKKPVAKAKKPVAAKAVVAKKPAVVAKAAKKPVAKKPAVAKFNLNKLMMLIVRDAPKKGKKMMGGYKVADPQIVDIKNIIYNFINRDDIRTRIRNRIVEVYDNNKRVASNHHAQSTLDFVKTIINLLDKTLTLPDFKSFVGYMNVTSIADELQNYSYNRSKVFDSKSSIHIKDIYDINFSIIIIALCKVYYYFNNSAEDVVDADKITIINPP